MYYNKNGQEALFVEMEKVYAEHMPDKRPSPNPKPFLEYNEENAIHRSNIATRYGLIDISHKLYYRTITYTSDDYIKRIAIQSDKIALEESKKEKLYRGIKAAIDNYGGRITIYDTIDLNLAKKP